MMVNKNPPAPEPVVNPYAAHDNVAVKRLALQGHRSAAVELVRRGSECETVTSFLERFLTADELKCLSRGQFDTLDDAFEEAWQVANRDTVEVPAVSNLNVGWGG